MYNRNELTTKEILRKSIKETIELNRTYKQCLYCDSVLENTTLMCKCGNKHLIEFLEMK